MIVTNELTGEKELHLIWYVADVHEMRSDLTQAQCEQVLENLDHYDHEDVGLDWSTLQACADELFPEGAPL